MAIFGPEFNKELQQESTARKELVGQTEAMEKKIEATTSAISEYNQKIQENQKAMEGMSKQQILQSNIVQEINALEEDRGELLKQRDEEKEEKAGIEELTPTFKDMQQSLFRISDAELERRQEFDKTVKLQEEQLEEFRRTNPEAEVEIAREQANIELMKEKEQKRREKQQTSIFKKGFKGIGNKLGDLATSLKDSIAGKAGFALKTALFIGAFFALSKFLQSEMFKKVTKFITEEFIPTMKDVFNFIMQPGGVFYNILKAFSGIGEFLVGLFDFAKGLFSGDSNLVKEGISGMIDGIFDLVGGIFEAVLGLFGFTPEQLAPISEFFGNFIGGFVELFKGFINNLIDGFALIFEGDIIEGIFTLIIAPFKYIGKAFLLALENMIDGILYFVNKIPGVNIENPFKSEPTGEGTELTEEEMRRNAVEGAGYNLDKRIDKSPDEMVAKKVDTVSTTTVVSNSTQVNNGGDTQAHYATRFVKDQSNEYANVM